MTKKVLKFGGTSVGSIDRIKNVVKIIISYIKKRFKVVVVSSAMSEETNKLIKLTYSSTVCWLWPYGSTHSHRRSPLTS